MSIPSISSDPCPDRRPCSDGVHLCMPACQVDRHMCRGPMPVLFGDEDSEGNRTQSHLPGARRMSPLLATWRRWTKRRPLFVPATRDEWELLFRTPACCLLPAQLTLDGGRFSRTDQNGVGHRSGPHCASQRHGQEPFGDPSAASRDPSGSRNLPSLTEPPRSITPASRRFP